MRQGGVGQQRWTVYGSSQAHSSLVKAAMMAGLGEDAVRSIEVDPETQAMDMDALRLAVSDDVEDGRRPVMVHLAAGTTSTGAMDDIATAAEIAREWGLWVHVDAAWAGVAAVCPELREHLARRRGGGLLRHQPPQVVAHDLRLQHLLGARPGRP